MVKSIGTIYQTRYQFQNMTQRHLVFKSQMKCQGKYVIHFLKCTSFNYTTLYIVRSVELRSSGSNHINRCRIGYLNDKFENLAFSAWESENKICTLKYLPL